MGIKYLKVTIAEEDDILKNINEDEYNETKILCYQIRKVRFV